MAKKVKTDKLWDVFCKLLEMFTKINKLEYLKI